jgi:DNA-binding CsgD family transcriptional regulator
MRLTLLPDVIRLAVAAGDTDTAAAAIAICTAETRAEIDEITVRRSQGLLDGDPVPILAAAEQYLRAGHQVLLAQCLEDGAALLAQRGDTDEARARYTEAVALFTAFGALWDLRRADARIRPYGVRRGVRGPRRRPDSGWRALTPTELTIANLVADGRSNPDIAAELLLSRRTVQSHVSHILAKLNARSRVDIAREAVSHRPSA